MSEPGLREKKKRAIEAELRRLAMELFAARGYDAVTVDAVADAAGVSRRTFFRYFPSKEDVFFARRRDQTERLAALVAAPRPGEAAFDRVRRALLELASEHVEKRSLILTEHAILAKSPALGIAGPGAGSRRRSRQARAATRRPRGARASARAPWSAPFGSSSRSGSRAAAAGISDAQERRRSIGSRPWRRTLPGSARRGDGALCSCYGRPGTFKSTR